MTMYKLYMPHIDKTGGQSVEIMMRDALDRAAWTYDVNPGSVFPAKNTDNYARIGMHQEFDPTIMDENWFKILIIREPLARFISAFNFFKFEVWSDTRVILNMNVGEFCVLTSLKETPATTPDWPKNLRGYISSMVSLNAEQHTTNFRFTNTNVFDVFDVVIDTSRLDELQEILEPMGINVNTDIRVNVTRTHLLDKLGINESDILTIDNITDSDKVSIENLNAFKEEQDLWRNYIAYRS